jgi:hypothetical protein
MMPLNSAVAREVRAALIPVRDLTWWALSAHSEACRGANPSRPGRGQRGR